MRFLNLVLTTTILAFGLSSNSYGAPHKDGDSFYELTGQLLSGKSVKFQDYKGKVVVVVNTATKCGTTPQFRELQSLYQEFRDQGLVILGFPSNDFTGVEPSDSKELSSFCRINYGVTFPVFRSGHVKGENAQPIYQYLTSQLPEESAGEISFNFEKILVSRSGRVVERYGSFTGAQSSAMKKTIKDLLSEKLS